MSKCMYTAQGDFVCNENKDTKDTTEHFETFHEIRMRKAGVKKAALEAQHAAFVARQQLLATNQPNYNYYG
jgi:hypothetical protein